MQVDPAAYLGRPLTDVQRELTALGLVVQVAADADAQLPADAVVSVTPNGALSRGDTVLVTYAVATAAPSPVPAPVAAAGRRWPRWLGGRRARSGCTGAGPRAGPRAGPGGPGAAAGRAGPGARPGPRPPAPGGGGKPGKGGGNGNGKGNGKGGKGG